MNNTLQLFNLKRLLIIAIGACGLLALVDPNYNTLAYKYYSARKDSAQNKIALKFFDHSIPVGYLKQKKLEDKILHPAAWAQQQISHDLASYHDFSKANVIATFNNLAPENLVVMFQIENGKVIVTRHAQLMNEACEHGLELYTRIFEYLAKNNYINNVSFLLRLTDYFPNITEQQAKNMAPILTTSKDFNKKIEQDLVLIPDYMSLEDIPKLTPRVMHANHTYPWRKKQHNILWRGGRADVSGLRQQVVTFSQQHPQSMIDAKFTDHKKDFMLPEFQLQSKFLLNIDGHTAAWTRPIWQLLSNSVMLKQESTLTQWYYAALEPDVHYISIPNDVNQIISIVNSYSDKQLQSIALAGSEFARNNLMLEDMIAYLVTVLHEYKALQEVT